MPNIIAQDALGVNIQSDDFGIHITDSVSSITVRNTRVTRAGNARVTRGGNTRVTRATELTRSGIGISIQEA